MNTPTPILLVPGLLCSPLLYSDQIPALWRFGPVTVADHTRDESMEAIARRILSVAPPSFVLVGLSMGGYIAFELLRQAPGRVLREGRRRHDFQPPGLGLGVRHLPPGLVREAHNVLGVLGKGTAARGQCDPAVGADKERVTEVLPQRGKRRRYGRFADSELRCGGMK